MLLLPAETFFVKRIWNICSYLCVSFGVYLHSICIYVLSHQHIGHGVLKEKAFRVYFQNSINLSCLSLETSANLVMSRAIFPYLVTRGRCKTRHMGRSKCNRSFHSQLCTCKPYNLECHYACIYGFNLFLTLCQPPVSVLVVDYPGRLYISMWLPARESLGGKNKCMWKWLPLVARWTDEMFSREMHRKCSIDLYLGLTVGWNENIYKNIINVTRSLYI